MYDKNLEKNMEKTRLLVIDDNASLIKLIKNYFKNSMDIEVVLDAKDGLEGIEVIHRKQDKFDLIVLDLIMPNKDGLEVLKYLQDNKIEKKVIVLTSYNSQDLIRKVSELGADYYILKPFELKTLEDKIKEISLQYDNKNSYVDLYNNNLQVSITKTLHELGVPSHIKGYQYIREGISIIYNHPDVIGGITKELYPEIAKKYHSTTSRVERAIRHAIEAGWEDVNREELIEMFGLRFSERKGKPTNSEFMATVADYIRLMEEV